MTEERAKRLKEVIAQRQPDLTVVLENVFDPHNVSAIMRTCDAVGIQIIHVLNTKIPRHKKWGYRSSSGAKKWLTVHQFDNVDECFTMLRANYQTILATHLSPNAGSVFDIDFTTCLALVFGNEHSGVSDEILSRVDGYFQIPQVGLIKSLNISVACAVCFYEAYRQKMKAGHYQNNHSETGFKESLQKLWRLRE